MPQINLFLEDCMEFMKSVPDKFYDLAIVDPPYGLNIASMNMGIGNGKKQSKQNNRIWQKKDWDKRPDKYYFNELFRISKNQIIWGGNYFELPVVKEFIIWDKKMPPGLSFADCEMAWTSFNRTAKIFRHSVYLDKSIKTHPTQKPVALYKWILEKYAQPGDKILDTHLGSGSIAIACHDYGFDLDGCELDAEYFEAAVKRYQNHAAQMKLF